MSFRRLALGSLTGFLSVVAFAHPLHAQEEDDDGPAAVNSTASLSAGADDDLRPRGRDEPGQQDPAGHALGRYGGVVPGSVAAPPAPPTPNESKPVITWPGFQMRTDGTSRVFIQSTVALSPQPSAAPGKFSVVLPGAKVAAGTNRLPLETRFFNTPVTRVNIAVKREAVTVTLDLRAEVAPVISSERGPNGFYFVYIDLPKGQYTKAEPTAIDAPPAPPPAPRARTNSGQTLGPSSLSSSASGQAEADSSTAKASAKVSGKAGIKLGP